MMNNPFEPASNLEIGKIIEVDGVHIIAELDPKINELTRVYNGVIYPIGQFGSIVKIHFGARLIFGYVGRLRMKSEYDLEMGIINNDKSARILEIDLFGEGEWFTENGEWKLTFERGITTYPLPLQKIYLTSKSEMPFIFGNENGAVIKIGEYVGSGGTPCYARINDLLGKHTAILGSTGSGKSGAVASILHSIISRGEDQNYQNWHPQIIIFDPHNEYSAAFPSGLRLTTDERKISIPYWILNFQETADLMIGRSEYSATSQSNILKNALIEARKIGANSLKIDDSEFSVDSPIPYSISILKSIIDSNKPSAASSQTPYLSIINKIDSLLQDSRLSFMMTEWDGKDSITLIINQFLGYGNPIKIIDFSGVPNEVAGATASAIARIIFSLKIWQTREERETNPVLLVCEEAHRYVPNSGEAQYSDAQDAIRRIAKEGRKYGIGLFLVTQRPSEVESTVLSQCNTWIVMRITNENDRNQVKNILPDSLSGLTKALSGLRRREAIFIGEASVIPSKILIRDLVKDHLPLPKSQDIDFDKGWQNAPIKDEILNAVISRWRIQKKD